MTLPQPKADEVADLLNAEFHKPRSDEFSLKRLEREIASLLRSSDSAIRTEALSLSGALAALRFDFPSMRRYYEQSLAAAGYSARVYFNFATVLHSMGIAGDALKAIESAVEKAPDDLGVLRLAVKAAGTAFDLEKLDAHVRRLASLDASDEDDAISEALGGTVWQRPLLETPGVTRQALLERFERARKVASEHRVRVRHERSTTSIRGTLVEWAVDCDADEIAQMNFEVALALSEFSPDPCESMISFGFNSMAILTPVEREKTPA